MSDDRNARFPCHEYVACTFGQGELGFDVAVRDALDPTLGSVVVKRVRQGEQAQHLGVQALDAIVSVDGEYVAFLAFEMVIAKLKQPGRPKRISFARPVPHQWLRIGQDLEAAVRIGDVEKLSSSLIARWQNREYVLSRTTLSYRDDNGVLRKKIPIEEITRVMPDPHSQDNFIYIFQGREVHLKCRSSEEVLLWLHALESTKEGCFENVDSVLARVQLLNNNNTNGNDNQGPSSNNNHSSQQEQSRQASSGPPPPPPVARSPYYLLNRSNISIKKEEDGGKLSNMTLPPPIVIPDFPKVDLSLERRIVARGSSS